MERYFAAMVPEDRERIDAAIRRAIGERQPYRVEYSILLPDGRRRHIHEEGEVLYGEGGGGGDDRRDPGRDRQSPGRGGLQ